MNPLQTHKYKHKNNYAKGHLEYKYTYKKLITEPQNTEFKETIIITSKTINFKGKNFGLEHNISDSPSLTK